MDIWSEINKIELTQILEAVGVKFDTHGDVLELYEHTKKTGGWRGSIKTGIVKDFSNKGRAGGDRAQFVGAILGLDKAGTATWFEDKFGIEGKKFEGGKAQSHNPILEKWNSLSSISEEHKTYLRSRAIDPDILGDLVKSNNGHIALYIRGTDGRIKSIQSRNINSTSNKDRFFIEKNTDANGVFFQGISRDERDLYVVEGMFDFLSMWQVTKNVVGLVSASQGVNHIKELAKRHNIIYIPDNDEAGAKTVEQFEEAGIRFSRFDLDRYGLKDVNDFFLYMENYGVQKSEALELIKAELIRPVSTVSKAFDQLLGYKKRYEENNGQLGGPSPYPIIDKYTQGVIAGKVYLLLAYSNQGKSKFSYSYVDYFLRAGKRIHFYSLEVDKGMLLANIIAAYYKWDFSEVFRKLDEVDQALFENIEIYDDIRKLSDIEFNIENELPDIAFIDFIQNIEGIPGSEYERMTKVAVDLQSLAIRTNTTIFNLSQVNNESRFGGGDTMQPKGSGAIFASSDVIFALYSDEGKRKLKIAKNKYGKANIDFDLEVDFSKGEFKVSECPFEDAATPIRRKL